MHNWNRLADCLDLTAHQLARASSHSLSTGVRQHRVQQRYDCPGFARPHAGHHCQRTYATKKTLRVSYVKHISSLRLVIQVIKLKPSGEQFSYFLHYMGWNSRWDKWVLESELMAAGPEALALQKSLKEKQKKDKVRTRQLARAHALWSGCPRVRCPR